MASSSIIKVLIKGDASDLNSAMDKSRGNLKKFAIAGAVAVGAAAVLGKALINAGERASTSNARILNITEQMGMFGDEADKVSGRLIKLAESTARQTGVDQNSIKMTQAKLLTFSALGETADEVGGAFDRATAAAVDMAAAGFGEASMNAVQLGKALQDPIKGITALGQSGATFTDAEKDLIKAMVEAGDTAGAQEMILAAVEKQVGGTAKATANASDKMKVAFSQVMEKVGLKLLPVFEKLTQFLVGKVIPAAERMVGFVRAHWIPIVAGLTAGFVALVPVLVALAAAGWAAVAPMLVAAAPFIAVGLAIAGLTAGVIWLYENWTPFQVAVDATAQFFKEEVIPVFRELVDFIADKVVPVVWSIAKIWIDIHIKIAEIIILVVGKVAGFVSDVTGFVATIVAAVWSIAQTWIDIHIKIAETIILVVGKVAGFVSDVLGHIERMVSGIFFRLQKIVDEFVGLPGRIWDALGDMAQWGVDLVVEIAKGIATAAWQITKAVTDAIPSPGSLVSGVAGGAKDFFGGLIPGGEHAAGTSFAPGGLSLVGEQGPELVNLPRGSQVHTASQTRRMMAGGGGGGGGGGSSYTVNVTAGMGANGTELGRAVVSAIKDFERSNGTRWRT